ncbi:hypothetical protein AVEN_262618-1 [Araneus ventricosus]|uniref:TTF-type domain-containing protein n=1 Tax=Araneus ventricosus TaxID=182803 RepID=A0A4Y2PIW4_ARAVE|nr:hypothetical protein AVEN_262618-1 [Araneus ventricosus]
MKRQAYIQNFFAKKQSVNRPVSDSAEVDCANNNVSSGVVNTSTVDPAPVAEDFKQVRKNIYDIGNYCQRNSVRSLTNEEKISLVENVWKLQPVYKFPSTFNSYSSNHSISFQMKWLEEFEWLAYTEEKFGSFYKYCVIFSHSKNVGKGDHQVTGALVTQAFSNLKKAKEMFRKHENCTYHKKSVLIAENTKSIVTKKSESVINRVNDQRRLDIEKKQKKTDLYNTNYKNLRKATNSSKRSS